MQFLTIWILKKILKFIHCIYLTLYAVQKNKLYLLFFIFVSVYKLPVDRARADEQFELFSVKNNISRVVLLWSEVFKI